MALVLPRFDVPDAERVLELMGTPRRGEPLYQARRELAGALERAHESERQDRARMARFRRDRAARQSEREATCPDNQ